ncbi:MAG: hypothetical protein ABR501_06860 [Pyrinomonadaceae bacterium]
MKKNQRFISGILLVSMVSISCAQAFDKKDANLLVASAPELRWKYESGG